MWSYQISVFPTVLCNVFVEHIIVSVLFCKNIGRFVLSFNVGLNGCACCCCVRVVLCCSSFTFTRVPDQTFVIKLLLRCPWSVASQVVGVLRSLLPACLFEHLSMSQARNPPTQRITSDAWSALSCPYWPCCCRMCVIAERLGCLQRLAHAAGHGHVSGASRTRRAVHNKLDLKIGDTFPFETVVLGECYNAFCSPRRATLS